MIRIVRRFEFDFFVLHLMWSNNLMAIIHSSSLSTAKSKIILKTNNKNETKTSIAVELSAEISGQSLTNTSWLRYTAPGRLGWSNAANGRTHIIKPQTYSSGNSSKYRLFHRRKIPADRFSRRNWDWTFERNRRRQCEMLTWWYRRGDCGGLGELLSAPLPSLELPPLFPAVALWSLDLAAVLMAIDKGKGLFV